MRASFAAPAWLAAARRSHVPPDDTCSPFLPDPRRSLGSALYPEHVDRAGRAEADHVGQADLRPLDLSRARLAAEVLRHLEDVGDAGGTQRMPLREEPARHVHGDAAAPLDLALVDQASRLAVGTE